MKIKKMEHIALNVRDFEESIKFYGEVLGFKQQKVNDFGEFIMTYMEVPGGTRLELVYYKGNSRDLERKDSDIGTKHITFEVEDVAKHEKELMKLNVPIFLETSEFPAVNARCVLFYDPSGNIIEFAENLE